MTGYWLGVDVGTTMIKAAAYRRDGTAVALCETPNAVLRGPGGACEQDMDAVWQGVCRVLQDLVGRLDGADIASVGLCGQGDGLWPLNAGRSPNGRAILWNDTRAADGVVALLDSGRAAAVGRASHTALWPGTSGALYRWLRDHAPDRARDTAHVVYCADWIGACLTGELATDFSNASIPFLDLGEKRYDDAALDALDCAGLRPKLKAPRRACGPLGRVTAKAAAATHLPEGTPVSVGTLDLAAMIVGMGMDAPGETMMVLGTTAVVNILADAIMPADLPVGATALHPTADVAIRILAPSTGTAAFDWFCGLHPQTLKGADARESAVKLNELAEQVAPGANGLTFLPYLNGERAPFVAPDARGVFFGLDQRSSRAEMGRSVMEGTAFSLRHCFTEEGGLPDRAVRLTGGGARNPLWCQIIADVIGVPVIVSEASDHGLWGAACLGASASGHGDACVLARRDDQTRTYEADPAKHRAYDQAFDRYLAISEGSRAIWHALGRNQGADP
ncbi:MAG: hypothetical protein JJ920_11820 [Roseitalea sp.]|jgi:sugar (pentulose or hexulose) kinase|nr:hypothetical protein [Roseitalea sp.]MBO6722941.1 hypothetical protein [Roseitalea sp.]MBO6743593.1 hypothetical protein [Roseitalea sp.]